jgi:hypothetical protein
VLLLVGVHAAGAAAAPCDSNNTSSFVPCLPGSNFESADGDFSPEAVFGANAKDWQQASGSSNLAKADDPVKSNNDNAFGQGTKEDATTVTVVGGSIPPNKDDLAHFAIFSETVTGDATSNPTCAPFSTGCTYMYAMWERTNTNGSAHMDFEINQKNVDPTGCLSPTNTATRQCTLNRTAGDILIDYDFGGSGTPTLTLHRWLTNGTASTCSVGSDAPLCWDAGTTLGSNEANGAVFTGSTEPDPIFGGPTGSGSVLGGQMGEMGINLTLAGIITPGQCETLNSAWLKSRSSGSSFSSEMKDFVAPVNIHISNCGEIIIRKVTVPSPDPLDTTFNYTTTGSGYSPFGLKNGQNNDQKNLLTGSYGVTETSPAPTYVLSNIDCSASKTTNGSTATPNLQTGAIAINLAAQDVIDCTYTNTLQQGAIKITKTAKNKLLGSGDQPQGGVTFTITGSSFPSGTPVVTGTNGVACLDHLNFGSYSVAETVPSGYQADSTNPQTVSVSVNATCGSGSEAGVSFHNTPLTDLKVTATSELAGATNSTITCVNTVGGTTLNKTTGPADPAAQTDNGLVPGTYTCTVVIDP